MDSVKVLHVDVARSQIVPLLEEKLGLRRINFREGENRNVLVPNVARSSVLDISTLHCSELAPNQLEREGNAPQGNIQRRSEHALGG